MKKMMKFSALLCAMALLVTACTREELESNFTPAADGSEIQFGSRAGFETTDQTRTAYSGEYYDTADGKRFERIDWVTGDMVEIYSPEAGGVNPAQYYVTQQQIDDVVGGVDVYDEGYLTKLDENAGSLRWNGDGTHTFYAMYPSSGTLQGAVSLAPAADGNIYINGVITNEQHAQGAETVTTGGEITHYELKPDMRFAYMAAVGSATPADGSVALNFVPIVTAIRVELALPTSGNVEGSTITSSPTPLVAVRLTGTNLVGDFTANLSSLTNGYPAVENGTDAENQSITMLVQGPDGLPITLQPGQSIAFTFFVRPGAAINLADLKVSFSSDGLNFKRKGLQATTAVTSIEPMKKTSLLGIKLPVVYTAFNYANWMDQVRDDAKIQELSLPGTGGSFSYAYTGSNASWYKQQTLPVFDDPTTTAVEPNQWDLGIRAFEMACDRPDGSTVASPGSLDGQQVRVNKNNMGITVGDALRALLDKVSNSNETAMAIITYQSEGGTGLNRHAGIFAGALAQLYDDLIEENNGAYADKMILFTPNTVMYDEANPANSARGKLMIVCRINQRGEAEHSGGSGINTNGNNDKDVEYTAANWSAAVTTIGTRPILLINGCGTAKDRWDARGYEVSADGTSYNPASTMLNAAPNAGTDVEYYMIGSRTNEGSLFNPSYVFSFPAWNVKAKEGGAYSYETSVNDQHIWYQEWARVVNLDYIAEQGGNVEGDFYVYKSTSLLSSRTFRWHESYNEKVTDAKHTFDLAIGGQKSDHVFINSLCGYLVDPDIENSYTMFGPENSGNYTWSGGTAGNIEELAKRINPEFGAYVMSIITAQGERGPTGVVMMDYLSNNPNDGASNFMPSILIQNNLYTGVLKGSDVTEPEEPTDPEPPTDPDPENKPGGGEDGGGEDGI